MAKGRRKGLSFLERNQLIIGSIALALIIGGTALALLLQGGLLTPTYRVTAYFTDAAGIVEGDPVTVAGLPAGTVKGIWIDRGRVAMELGIEEAVELPADSSAEVMIETLLGRRSVAVIAGEGDEPLQEGDVIPVERTTTPVDITELNDISVELLESSDADAFEGFLSDLAEITEGKTQDVSDLITGLNQVLGAVDSRRQQLGRLIESLRTLSVTFGQRDDQIVDLIDNLDIVLGNLAERQDELETLLVTTASASQETTDLVRRNRAVLDQALNNLDKDLRTLDKHQLDLAATIAYLENAVQGYSSVGYSAGGNFNNHWANIFVQSLGPVGVDGVIGDCGMVDDLIDEYFGTNCEDPGGAAASGQGQGGGPGETTGEGGQPSPPVEVPPIVGPPESPGLPCGVGDVVDSVLAGTESGGSEECEG
jgi:phospholipid/cholesterol/gamma-HCH transport system substrate-binding protein